MSVVFSDLLVKEYQIEQYLSYGVLVNEEEALTQLLVLVRSIFPTVIAEQKTESRELGQGLAQAALAPARFQLQLKADGGSEVGAVLPRLRDKETKNNSV